MRKTAREVIASGDVRLAVDFGIELDRRIKAEADELEEIKAFLRQIGGTSLADRLTEKTVQLEGNLGVITVTYPADAPRVRKGVDLLASEPGIPPGVFKALFTKKTVVDFAKDFLVKLRRLPRPDQELIEGLVETHPTTPRVYWPK